MLEFVDSHCHLDFDDFSDDLTKIIANASNLGVKSFVIPAVSAKHWQRLIDINRQVTGSHISFGLHPYFVEHHQPEHLARLDILLDEVPCIAVGECGIDASVGNIERQTLYFRKQIELANKHSKPLILHHRKSHHIIFQCFKDIRPQFGGVVHAFSGSLQDAQKYIELGFALGAGGTITYQRANKTRDVFQQLELAHIVLETDSPDMPLFGMQGQRNEPKNVVQVAETLARLRECSIEQIALETSKNCQRIFGI